MTFSSSLINKPVTFPGISLPPPLFPILFTGTIPITELVTNQEYIALDVSVISDFAFKKSHHQTHSLTFFGLPYNSQDSFPFLWAMTGESAFFTSPDTISLKPFS